MINHFIMPHRDDLMLSLGGFLLKNINETNIEYLVYGTDSYLDDKFKKEMIEGGNSVRYLKKLAEQAGLLNLFNELIRLVKKDKENHLIGIYTRFIEEKALANLLNIQLNDFFLPCGYPLRGYQRFNSKKSDLFSDDFSIQKDILTNGSQSKYYSKIELLADKSLGSSGLEVSKDSLLDSLKRNIRKSKKEKHNIYLLAGIGGHPDHIVLAYFINTLLTALNGFKITIFVAQDIPYASVNEWFQYSPLELNSLEKVYVEITDVLDEKIKLLNQYYKSQLNKENLRVIKEYHLSAARLLDKTYAEENLVGLKVNKNTAFEILYKVK